MPLWLVVILIGIAALFGLGLGMLILLWIISKVFRQ